MRGRSGAGGGGWRGGGGGVGWGGRVHNHMKNVTNYWRIIFQDGCGNCSIALFIWADSED